MKPVALLLFVFLWIDSLAGDTTDLEREKLPYYIRTCTDVMTDKEYAFGSKVLFCSEDGKKGFVVRISWSIKKGNIKYEGLTVKSADIGTCNENDELIFLFEDDTKTKLVSWQKFNCEGNSYFDFGSRAFDELSSKKIKAIRFTNGRSYDSFTYVLKDAEKIYFIEAKEALENKKFVRGKCN